MEKNNLIWQDISLIVLRFVVAVIFLYAAWAKIPFWSSAPAGFSSGMLMLIKFLSIVEPLGAIGLIFGILTRWAAAGLAIIMVGAIFSLSITMHVAFFTSLQGIGWDYNLLIFACCLAITSFGPGRWSVDSFKSRD